MSHEKWRPAVFLSILAFCAALAAVRGAQEPPNGFTFAILGDRTGTPQAGVYEAIWSEIAHERPAFVINAGDSIQGGDDATAAAEWAALRPLWKGIRFYPVPGNHDLFSEASRRVWEQATGHKPFYSFDFEQAHFTVLDNSQSTDLSAEQLAFLREDLARHAARNPKFVFFHKPFWLLHVALGSGDFPLHRIAREFGVQYVISGHGHQFLPLAFDGVTYLEVGSSGGKLKGSGFAKGWFYHHVLAQVRGAKVEMTVKEPGPPVGEGRHFRLEEWKGLLAADSRCGLAQCWGN